MKNLQRLVLVGLSTLVFSFGCKDYRIEYSEVKHETARVTLHEYVPESTSLSFDIDMDGGISNSIDTDPEEYNITFKGKIDFELDNKEIFDRFKLEDKADVSYKEKHGKTYDRDGKTRYLKKDEIVGNEFVDAWPIKD